MTDAPETIWLSVQPDYWENELGMVFTFKNGSHGVKYRRDDLPPTPAQIMADPRVQALVEAAENALMVWNDDKDVYYAMYKIVAALAALEKP